MRKRASPELRGYRRASSRTRTERTAPQHSTITAPERQRWIEKKSYGARKKETHTCAHAGNRSRNTTDFPSESVRHQPFRPRTLEPERRRASLRPGREPLPSRGASAGPTATPRERWEVGRASANVTKKPGLALLTARPPQEEATPSVLGHQTGLLMLLCQDKDEVTGSYSRQCVYLLLQLLIQHKGELRAGRGRRVGQRPGRPLCRLAPLGFPRGLERRAPPCRLRRGL